ncbi:MAG: hypothetical protein AAFY64_00315 [Pseudomonadota bacterium]
MPSAGAAVCEAASVRDDPIGGREAAGCAVVAAVAVALVATFALSEGLRLPSRNSCNDLLLLSD